MPSDGVYAVVAKVLGEDTRMLGVANLGVRPTMQSLRRERPLMRTSSVRPTRAAWEARVCCS